MIYDIVVTITCCQCKKTDTFKSPLVTPFSNRDTFVLNKVATDVFRNRGWLPAFESCPECNIKPAASEQP